MKKEFTKEDMLQKHETNIKSASTVILLTGILGLIYAVRFFLSGNFNYFFSLSFTDMILKIGQEKGNIIIPAVISVIYILAYTSLAVFANKSTKLITVGLGIYLFDFICLIGSMIFLFPKPLDSAVFIEVIVHLLVSVFLVVGIISAKKIKEYQS